MEQKETVPPAADRYGPVSYTHLDVYKRQTPEDIVILLRSPGPVLWAYTQALNEAGIPWHCLLYTSRCV